MVVIENSVKQDYKLGRILGQGGYATVKSAKSLKTGKSFACKIINKTSLSKKDIKNLQTEVSRGKYHLRCFSPITNSTFSLPFEADPRPRAAPHEHRRYRGCLHTVG